ncbi:flagellar hook-associated protein [Mangrovibacter phragmitis]|uniref:Flagellar hook-associated protein 2 n=1 Tax=Mangrovibacter phragmitis TaxID=1691903 RepID=A0A1B7L3U6_9ENTR|nr:flagellar filament capping protein FliD [Mangrovibacter phragmitis]OAT76935.1 flagellar hook-associated protein [Mangrovibacter phragmitis]
MSDLLSLDPQTLATQLAFYDIQPMQNAIKTQTATLNAQQTALRALRTALTDFRTAIQGMNQAGQSMLQTQATTNMAGIANVTTTDAAQKGTYNIEVDQLASAHQTGYAGLTDEDIRNASGTMTIALAGEELDIDLSEIDSLADLAAAINNAEDNPGVTASLVRTDGKVMLMLSSDETGATNTLDVQISGDDATQALFANPAEISPAQDAQFRMGEVSFTHSSNTIDNLIDGVTVELIGVTDGKPLTIHVDTDIDATKDQVNTFVDSWNTLMTSLNTLTSNGADGERGALAGDPTISALQRDLNTLLRSDIDGFTIADFGISADRNGKLKIDNDTLTKQLQSNPQSVTTFFNGPDGMLSKMDKSLDRYLNSTDGLLKSRQETLDRRQEEIDRKSEKMNTRYDSAYNRYLRQFTQLQQVTLQMNSTMSMFGLV